MSTWQEASRSEEVVLTEEVVKLYRSGRFEQADAACHRLLDKYASSPQGWLYGGLLAMQNQQLEKAERCFETATRLDPNLAVGWMKLGAISEERQDYEAARSHYARAHRLRPDEKGPKSAWDRVSALLLQPSIPQAMEEAPGMLTPPTESGQPAPMVEELDIEGSPYGVYEVLTATRDPYARHPLTLLRRLQIPTRRPFFAAFIYRFLFGFVAAALLAYIVTQIRQTTRIMRAESNRVWPELDEFVLVFLILAILITIWLAAVILTTQYTIDKGRVQVVSGILVRRHHSIELYRATDATITANLFQQVTGDGALVLHTPQGPTRLIGIERGVALAQLWQRLLNTIFALRTTNAVRGIIS